MLVQIQKDLERLDGGSSAYIYAVNDQVVLKSPVTFVPPTDDSSQMAQYEYALNAVCHHEDIANERIILKRLERIPHPNILQAISLEHPEGIYLRRHIPLSRRVQTENAPQSMRIAWYRDMLRALVHLHKLEIAHADVRLDNFLCHSEDTIVLCDFTCSGPFGQDNPSATSPSESLGVNGPSQIVSDITDRFALASVMFEIETGTKPDLTLVNNKPELPAVKTGNKILDLVIERAWLAKYESSMDMLRDIESLFSPSGSETGSDLQITAVESLQTQVNDWRRSRVRKHGNFSAGQRLVSRLLTLPRRSSIVWSVYGRTNQSSQAAPKIGIMFG
ncbi:MAG: hypothetical protein Q9197_005073 [Variospora fuerteventurae]